ncbi:MAG: GspMb/PilO family protein [Candidatus Aminicenantales bacterium]
MKELFRTLGEKERTRLKLLGLLFLIALLFFLFFSLGQRRSYHLLADQLKNRKSAAVAAAAKQAQSTANWEQWEQTLKDIQFLKEKFFYREGQEINELRLDLRKIFSDAGINTLSLKYNYANLEKERIGKISVTFNFTGSYPVLKRFLQMIERYPKFLLLEKIDFLKISEGGTVLELRIMLAGYYAHA